MSRKKPTTTTITADKKYVVAIDLDHTALVSNDLGGLRSSIDMDALSDSDALELIRRVTNPRLIEAIKAMRARKIVDRIVFYTAKGGLLHGLSAPQDLWLTDHTLRFRAGPASRKYLYNQLLPAVTPKMHADFVGLGALTWGLSCLLGLKTLSAPVYITREPKNPDLIAHDLDVPHVVLFDDQADYYASRLMEAPSNGLFRSVTPFEYMCLSPAQAYDLEAFLQSHCGPPIADCDVATDATWRVRESARGDPMPPWFIDDL
jgi:hypothetical protein